MHTSYEAVDHVTGQILRQRFAIGEATNSDALRVRFDGLRSASVEGTIRVSETRCDRSGRCEDRRRRITLDLEWGGWNRTCVEDLHLLPDQRRRV